MGKNRHAYTDARGDLIYYSSKEGKTGSGSKYCKQIAKTLPKKDKRFTKMEQRQIDLREREKNRVKKND
tara:strand:- start:360 stop:566 length:207 start_codon:yes stop_codon:yes gene_type:complete